MYISIINWTEVQVAAAKKKINYSSHNNEFCHMYQMIEIEIQ